MPQSKDLFDDSTMTFGEHLEVLRLHLIRSIIGLIIVVLGTLYYGDRIVGIVRQPIDEALQKYGQGIELQDDLAVEGPEMFSGPWWNAILGLEEDTAEESEQDKAEESAEDLDTGSAPDRTIRVKVLASEIASALHDLDPDHYPAPPSEEEEETIELRMAAPEFSQLEQVIERQSQAVTLNVQEAFLTYLKVAFIAGLVIASPWIFYQLWLFVAAGLYPHERRYVHIYLPISLALFLIGVVFCFYMVFPFVLKFLLGFNAMLGVQPQIRLSEWISFAITLPLMFGVSFQLPLVMLFLERISVFDVAAYRQKRRMAVLVIAFLSMMLTPADPMSMLLMMAPLVLLYELGIFMCALKPTQSGFPEETQPA